MGKLRRRLRTFGRLKIDKDQPGEFEYRGGGKHATRQPVTEKELTLSPVIGI